jgi:enterochelin esterase-like enzyme/sugar lactone lactonase YvrE
MKQRLNLLHTPVCFRPRFLVRIVILIGLLADRDLRAQDWAGPFTISPVSAPEMVLESVGAGTTNGTPVSLNHPSAAANQVWIITPKGDGFYTLKPSNSPNPILAVSGGKTDNGAVVALAAESDPSWQWWSLKQNDNGSCSLTPKFAPAKGLDDFGGDPSIGARVDLWDFNATDEHLQWILTPMAGAKVPANRKHFAEVPRGVIKNFTFADSAVFPGTRRNGTVFIPAQYDGSKPACVYVEQDGYNGSVKTMLETLIAARDMPVTIGVFIAPGEVPSPAPNTMGRRNRCFEYDGVGDNYVRFLTGELLPFVAKNFNLRLSESGNDRCIAGASSGGISAFNTAWERPEAFSRVYACSGSFVAFRGGQEFPTLVRKCEAKPIRAFLTTATQDMENCAGDWYLLDQEMDKALTFAGYDHIFRPVTGPHCAGWNDLFPEAMRFVWRDWPEPVKAGQSAPRVRDILEPNQNWELVAQGYPGAGSPAVNSAGEVFFIHRAADQICRLGLEGKIEVFRAKAAQANGLCFGPKDELYSVSRHSGNLLAYDRSGQSRVVAHGIQGNFILARPDGSLYVTSTGDKSDGVGQVWLVKNGRKTLVDSGLKSATGLAYRPDQWLLSVADGQSKWVYSYQIQPDGSLTNKERFFWLHVADGDDEAGAASICYAREGQMFVATRTGIQICADDGPTQVILPLPDHSRVQGICLGGAGMNTLFAFGGDKIWKRLVKPHGMGAFSPPTRIKGSPL